MPEEKRPDPQTPMCDKWAAASDKVEVVREFLDFLREQKIELYEPTVSKNVFGDLIPGPSIRSNDALVYDFVGVNPQVLDDERRSILDWMCSR